MDNYMALYVNVTVPYTPTCTTNIPIILKTGYLMPCVIQPFFFSSISVVSSSPFLCQTFEFPHFHVVIKSVVGSRKL